MSNKKIIELLKSGDFTIAYHDNGACGLYKGKMTYDQICDKELDSEITFEYESFGYVPAIVEALVKALGGKVDSV